MGAKAEPRMRAVPRRGSRRGFTRLLHAAKFKHWVMSPGHLDQLSERLVHHRGEAGRVCSRKGILNAMQERWLEVLSEPNATSPGGQGLPVPREGIARGEATVVGDCREES